VTTDDDVLDLEDLDGVLHDRQAVEVGMHHDVGDVAVHKDFARFQAGDLIRGHPAVGTADPQIGRALQVAASPAKK
jgi:hypothetical protein